jgi:hypothetical protein
LGSSGSQLHVLEGKEDDRRTMPKHTGKSQKAEKKQGRKRGQRKESNRGG